MCTGELHVAEKLPHPETYGWRPQSYCCCGRTVGRILKKKLSEARAICPKKTQMTWRHKLRNSNMRQLGELREPFWKEAPQLQKASLPRAPRIFTITEDTVEAVEGASGSRYVTSIVALAQLGRRLRQLLLQDAKSRVHKLLPAAPQADQRFTVIWCRCQQQKHAKEYQTYTARVHIEQE